MRRAIGSLAATVVLTGGGLALGVGDDGGQTSPRSNVSSLVPVTYPEPREPRRAPRPAPKASDELTWPLEGAVTGEFGEWRGGHEHAGIDIPMPEGTPIEAAADGKVVMQEVQDGYGNYTCIAHVKISTCYAHQSRFRTELGERVRRGQVIGEVGATGSSTTSHLHFEVRRGTQPWGMPVEPMKFLPAAGG